MKSSLYDIFIILIITILHSFYQFAKLQKDFQMNIHRNTVFPIFTQVANQNDEKALYFIIKGNAFAS